MCRNIIFYYTDDLFICAGCCAISWQYYRECFYAIILQNEVSLFRWHTLSFFRVRTTYTFFCAKTVPFVGERVRLDILVSRFSSQQQCFPSLNGHQNGRYGVIKFQNDIRVRRNRCKLRKSKPVVWRF